MSCYPVNMRGTRWKLVCIFGALLVPGTAFAEARLVPAADGGLDIREGDNVLGHVVLQAPPLRRGPARLRRVDVDGHAIAEVRVPVRGTPAEEVWIGELPAGPHHPEGKPDAPGHPVKVLWSGRAGPRDTDAETSVAVAVTEDEVLEYQTAAGVIRCDGVPARLFPRAYDFDSGRFRPVLSPVPEPGIETLPARRGDPAMPAGRPVGGFHWTSASTTRGAGNDARGLAAPVELDDGNPATAWAEGLGGDGRGEFLTARSSAAGYAVRGLRIIPGDASSPEAFRAKNRVRRFQVAFGPAREQRFDVDIGADPAAEPTRFREPYWIPLPKPMPAACVTVVIEQVFAGTEAAPPKTFGTTAISELALFTDVDGPQAADRLVADLAKAPDCGARLPLVVGLGDAAVLPTAQAVLAARGSGRECLVEALATLEPAPKNPIVLEALTAALSGASEKEERLVTAALVRAPSPPISAIAELMESPKAAVEDRTRAARVLGTLDDERAAAALLGAAGQGPSPLRTAVVDALGHSPKVRPEMVLAPLKETGNEGSPRQADLLRAVPAVVKRHPERIPEAVAAIRAGLAPERSFEVRARAIMALGALGPAGAPGALAAVRAQSNDPVLRYLATRELAGFGAETGPAAGTDVGAALRVALADQDPRVRETAALALGRRRDAAAASLLMSGAKGEPWPFVRRAELEALGELCTPGSGDLLIRAVERDVDEVRRAAMVSLARCKDPRARGILSKTLARRNESATLRELAAALIGESGDRSAAPALAEALKHLVVESEGDLALEGVAATALRALARLGGPEALNAALALAADTRHPFRGGAIEALGTLCDPGRGQAALQSFVTGPDPALAVAAQNAQRRCARK